VLQAGIMASGSAYLIHIDRWMALAAGAIFVPQVIFARTAPMTSAASSRRLRSIWASSRSMIRGAISSIISQTYRLLADAVDQLAPPADTGDATRTAMVA
jgi:hypothetical protein